MAAVVVVVEVDVVVAAGAVVVDAELELLLPPHPPMASVATTIAAAPSWLAFLDFIGCLRCGRAPAGSPVRGSSRARSH
jgi:hypothetical protein